METNRPVIEERKIEISQRLSGPNGRSRQKIPEKYALNVKMSGPESGPAMVFLHGGGGESNNWKHQMEEFASKGYRVIAIDGNGCGKSDYRAVSIYQKSPHKEHAYDVSAVLDELGVKSAVFVGHSDGGAIAQTLTVTDPDRMAAQVLVGAPTEYALFDKLYNALIAVTTPSAAHYPKTVLWAANKMFFGTRPSGKSFSQENQMPTPLAMRNWVRSLEFFKTPDVPVTFIPTLVMHGENDGITRKQQAPLAEKWGADLIVVPNAGHVAQWENPGSFNGALEQFLTRKGLAPKTA